MSIQKELKIDGKELHSHRAPPICWAMLVSWGRRFRAAVDGVEPKLLALLSFMELMRLQHKIQEEDPVDGKRFSKVPQIWWRRMKEVGGRKKEGMMIIGEGRKEEAVKAQGTLSWRWWQRWAGRGAGGTRQRCSCQPPGQQAVFFSGNLWVFKTWQESGLWSKFSSHDCAFSDCSPSPRGGIRESEKLDSHCLECVRLSLLDSVQTLVLYFLSVKFSVFSL